MGFEQELESHHNFQFMTHSQDLAEIVLYSPRFDRSSKYIFDI